MDALKNNKDFLLQIVNKTSTYTGKQLLRNEIEGLIQYINELNFNLMKNEEIGSIINKIAKNFSLQLRSSENQYIDIHELMKGFIGLKNDEKTYMGNRYGPPSSIKSSFQSSAESLTDQNSSYRIEASEIKKNNIFQPTKSIQNLYLLLDSKYRNLSTDPSVFSWTVLNTPNTTQGTVNTLCDKVHNIINMQFELFNIPYVGSADNIYRKISLFVEEFSSMSVLTNDGNRYHIMLNSSIIGNRIELHPQINDKGRFRFYNPINILNNITIRMRSPFSPITFLKDRYNVQLTSFSPLITYVLFTEDHKVSDGELIYFSDYNTLSPIVDEVYINEINRENGHIVTFINDTTLSILANLSTVNVDTNNITVCFIASRRIIIPIRMEYTG